MKNAITWGILFSLTSLIWVVLEFLLGYHTTKIDQHAIVTNFFAIPAIVLMVLGMLSFKKQQGGTVNYMQSFMSGVYISVVVAILSVPVQLGFFTFVNPAFFETFQSHSVKIGSMTSDEAAAYFNLNTYLIEGAVGAIIMGVFTSAIAAIFIRSKTAS